MVLATVGQDELPKGETLMIHPPYVHYIDEFVRDGNPYLPIGLLYAGEQLEKSGLASVQYHDAQLHDLRRRDDYTSFDSIGINTMGTQNISAARWIYDFLVERGVDPRGIYLGGQGVEGLFPEEFAQVFPKAHQSPRAALSTREGYWDTTIDRQMDKFSDDDLRIYLSNELTLVFSQGCMFACDFCGAQVNQRESFYNTEGNLRAVVNRVRDLDIDELSFYCTSLDFFQDVLSKGVSGELEARLRAIETVGSGNGAKMRLRALTRADSYLKAANLGLVGMSKDAGFYQFGFGADGAADVRLLKAIHKGDTSLGSRLFRGFQHAESNGISPEILYVFGIPEDTDETLGKTRDLCIKLLEEFGTSVYRGFPAKNEIPGNKNWLNPTFRDSDSHRRLLAEPRLFLNLGFETLANSVSHPDRELRKKVNSCAVEMSQRAHELGRVQSFLTVPLMDTDGHELMDQESFENFREIARNYAPDFADDLTLENLPEYRAALNRRIPKDK